MSDVVGNPDFFFTRKLFYFFQVAAKGNLEEFRRLYYADISKLGAQDNKGVTAVHKAAKHGRVNILQFIADHNGGMVLHYLKTTHFVLLLLTQSCSSGFNGKIYHSEIVNEGYTNQYKKAACNAKQSLNARV